MFPTSSGAMLASVSQCIKVHHGKKTEPDNAMRSLEVSTKRLVGSGYTSGSSWLSLEGRLLCSGTVTKMERGYCSACYCWLHCNGGEKEKLGKEVYLAGRGVYLALESP